MSSVTNYADWVTRSKIRSTSVRRMLAHRIGGNGSGSWPTSRAEDSESCGNHGEAADSLNAVASTWSTPRATEAKDVAYQYDHGDHTKPRLSLTGEAQMWSTPNTPNGGRSVSAEVVASRGATENGKRQVGLESETRHWPTPDVRVTTRDNTSVSPGSLPRPALAKMTSLWTTPQAHDQNGGDPTRVNRFGTEHGGANLADDVTTWASPTARMYRGGGQAMTRKDGKTRLDMLDYQAEAYSPPDQPTNDGPPSSPSVRGSRPRLNPAFACSLMGLPCWWTSPAVTSSVQSEMEAYHSALQSRSVFLLGES